MKNLWISVMLILALQACVKPGYKEGIEDKWNGYAHYLKYGERVHNLMAGQHTLVGTVTYGLDSNANFYAIYDCAATGCMISETHFYAGDKAGMPVNKPGAPKVGNFPYSNDHSPRVSAFTYWVPLSTLPPCTSPGFVVAAHAVVHLPSGQTETAWAEGSFTFSDKGWGWYDVFYYNQVSNPFTILYCFALAHDSLKLYHLDITNQTAELTYSEYTGNSPGTYDAGAYDPETGILYFVNTVTAELWVNNLKEDSPSFSVGTLSGTPVGATFRSGKYYYADAQANTIHMVEFHNNFMVNRDSILDTVPGAYLVNDLAVSPDGGKMYISAESPDGTNKLIFRDMDSGTYYSSTCLFNNNAQIAFGSDGLLYAISPLSSEGNVSEIKVIDTETDTLTIIEEDIIYIEDPFSDISRGPIM